MNDYDVIFAGGGLASTLSACRVKARRPELRMLVVEAGERLGGNHTWSCHATDLTAEQHGWMAPFIAHRWPGQMVRFPKLTRHAAGSLSVRHRGKAAWVGDGPAR